MGKKNIKLVLEYDGERYHGWQRQKEQATVQGVIEKKIKLMTGAPVTLTASGRTDAGVHAIHQACNFITESKIDPLSFKNGLNSLVPCDIHIKQAEYVPLDFHSRYSARSKVYEYRILNRDQPDIFLRNYSWHIRSVLNISNMGECASLLMGLHDFSSFKSTGSGNLNPVRNMITVELHTPSPGALNIIFEADGFLRHMVRNIVGTLVEVGSGRISMAEFREIFQARDRQAAGMKSPPHGLFLKMVRY